MHIAPRSNGIVWIDIDIPLDQPSGRYEGAIEVRAEARGLSAVPLELEVVDATLPDRTGRAVAYYDPGDLARRVGPDAEARLWQLLHAHRISPLHDATLRADIERQRSALDGSLYTSAHGYAGPAVGQGDGVMSLGAYGALGAPNEQSLGRVQELADAIAEAKLFESADVFLYAADELCSSSWGRDWRDLLDRSGDPNVRRLRVGWTCSDEPTTQPVDIAMLHATFDAEQGRRARDVGKEVWVYNGVLPRTGTFLLDADAVSPRVNGWLGGIFDVPRWFYWQSTFWYGQHDARAIDPFVEPESLHSDQGDWANGDGVLVYPATQRDMFEEHSLADDGVLPTIRLKNWRRGLEDAGYFELAEARDAERAHAVASWLIPAAFDEAEAGQPASWGPRGQPFFDARRALLAIALGQQPVLLEKSATVRGHTGPKVGFGVRRALDAGGPVGLLLALGGVGFARSIRRGRGR